MIPVSSCRLREYTRSESAKSFNESEMKRARLRALGLAYLSPQNKSLAHSFRYMRHKPTIIAFKTPSLESCHARLKALAAAGEGPMASASSQTKSSGADGNGALHAAAAACAEEGRGDSLTSASGHDGLPFGERATINYPVGKPLEVSRKRATDNERIKKLQTACVFRRFTWMVRTVPHLRTSSERSTRCS